RKPSAYGIEMCRKILSPLCDKGCTIISGLAMGIDTAAHQTALSANSHTIAVLASGVESIYPPMNQPMAEKIIKKGALLSEYEPGTKMERWNFPARNRIISALAQGVFIVECPLNSGALLTAKFATEQSREIFALPGNINNRNAQGPNSLIRDGAMLISCPEDLVQHLGFSREVREQMELIPELNNEEQVIYDLMGKQQKDVSFDEFLLHTGFSFGKLSIVLLNLELKGIIAKSSGNSFIRI
ncbi:MAG: DNA-processing protein DprA, partial [Candidatus Cloacimonetes bacterium]|nr:DNA-processing protein DprA [Candidatus Cloacimonadota bacterium]